MLTVGPTRVLASSRPKNVDEVSHQGEVVESLRSAIKNKNVRSCSYGGAGIALRGAIESAGAMSVGNENQAGGGSRAARCAP